MTSSLLTGTARGAPRGQSTRDVDWALAAGAASFAALILLAIYGPLLAPHDLYYSRALIDGKGPPFPPGPDYLFGSDNLGRDRFSWLLIGARGTVIIALAASTLRVLVGASLGTVAGFRGGATSVILRQLALSLSSIPATVAILLGMIAIGASPEQFVLALGLVGWAEPFHQARRLARAESARPFMEAARSLGLRDRRLVMRHLLPNLAPALLTTATFQVSAVFLLMGELALLNMFVGGTVVVDYDSVGNAIVAPRIANWASMLGTTRPIVSLYGDLAAVLLPGGALLGAVLATNLFGDALAARAQRLDVYRAFSRRHLITLAVAAGAVASSLAVWPSRLSTEIAYASGFDTGRGLAVAHELAVLSRRSADSTADASALMARSLSGTVVRATTPTVRVRESGFSIEGVSAKSDSVTILSLNDADASGPLWYVDLVSVFPRPSGLTGAIVVVDPVIPSALASVVQRLAAAGARAVVVLQPSSVNYRRAADAYSLPTLSIPSGALVEMLHTQLPSHANTGSPIAPIANLAGLRIRTFRAEQPIINVVTTVRAANPVAPLIFLAADYASFPDAGATWANATAAATLVTIVDHLRSAPIDVEVVAVATSADDQDYSGLRVALAELNAEQRTRLQAIIIIGPMLSSTLVIDTQADPNVPSGTGRLAARLHDALGVAMGSTPPPDLLGAIQSSGVSAPAITLSAQGPDQEPPSRVIENGARAVLVTLAYVPGHLSEMR